MSQVCALWNLGSKGQRSRSQCKDYWKWFLAHNCFPFTPIFMKLHMQSPHESSMDPMDFGVKRSKVKVTMQEGFWRITASPIWCITWRVWIGCRGGYFVPLGQPHSSFFCVFLGFGYKISNKPRIPSDNLDPASIVNSFLCVTTSVMTKTSVCNIIPQAKANHYKRYVQNENKTADIR